MNKASDEESGPYEQDHGEGHLSHHQPTPDPGTFQVCGPGTTPHSLHRTAAGGANPRDDSDEDPRPQGKEESEAQNRQGETRTWLYRLLPGIRWHDGAPFTTRDIAFSSDFYRHPDVVMEDPEATTLEVLDDSTFTITYHQGYPVSFNYGVYLPAHILGALDPADRHDWEYWRAPLGYGPFRYVRTQSG